MIVEATQPRYDAILVRHAVVDADPAHTLEAAAGLDLLTVRTPLLVAAMWIRGLPAKLTGTTPLQPPSLVIADGGLPGWLVLGRDEREIAFGAVGRFWTPVIEWRDVPREEFAAFDEPGWGKIVANLSVRPYGNQRTLLSYECRTVITDARSRRRFQLYWLVVRPFVAHIMGATLAAAKADAESTLACGVDRA
ncbi:hypothetical protein BVC93_03185 [Mycobacterium sp. MS1601]|nr:hypothetical protein BVC93_03185 [Mycobacterium sp. MS1601]